MKNKALIRFGLIVVLLIVAFFIYKGTDNSTKESDKEVVKAEPITYEVLDQSVDLNDKVKKWLEDNLDKEGFYTIKADNKTYVLISGGKQQTTGYGISLNAVNQDNKDITVEYEILSSNDEGKVEKKESNPHMIIRFASKDAKIVGKIAPLEDVTKSKTEK